MKIYDLTHYIEEDMSVYCMDEKAEFSKIADYEEGYSVTRISLGTHTGTHIDVPRHIFRDGKGLEDYNLEEFIGQVTIINCLNYKEIGVEVIKDNIEDVKKSKYVIFYTGYTEKWKSSDYFKGYPILTKEAVSFISNIKELRGIGVDCISVDGSDSMENHKILLGNNKLILENLSIVKELTGKYDIIISPIKLKNGDGSPIRVYLFEKI